MEKNQKHIEDIFREAFQHHEMDVNPSLWAGVQSTMSGTTGAVGATATGAGMMKAAAVVGISSIIAVGTINEVKLQSSNQGVQDAIVIENVEPVRTMVEETAQLPTEPMEHVTNEMATLNPGISADDVSDENVELSQAVVSSENEVLNEPRPEYQVEAETADAGAETEIKLEDREVDSQPVPKMEASPEDRDNTVQNENPAQDEPSASSDYEEQEQEKEETPVCSIHLAHDAKGFISPDGDGANDCFEVPEAYQAKHFQITIYTREGLEVFRSEDPYFKWCGTDNLGNLLPNRTLCFYEILAVDENDIRYTKRNARGSIHVFH